jgi:hypothetical protein
MRLKMGFVNNKYENGKKSGRKKRTRPKEARSFKQIKAPLNYASV